MARPMFILNGDTNGIGVEYKNGLFPHIPNHNKYDAWSLLTDGIADDVVVDDRLTVKDIRRGQYKRLVEISRSPQIFIHTFKSNCQEATYKFKVTIKANVYVNNPIKFYNNFKNISVHDFLDNQFFLDVGAVTRKYSILNYSGIDEELKRILTASVVSDDIAGLSYQIIAVMTEPDKDSMELLKQYDDMVIRREITNEAEKFAVMGKAKTYADVIWEEVAKGKISPVDAVQLIDEYNKKSIEDKIDTLNKLLGNGIINNTDFSVQAQNLFPGIIGPSQAQNPSLVDTSEVDELFEETGE